MADDNLNPCVYDHHTYSIMTSANFEILHCSKVFARCQKLFEPESIFMQTHVNFFTAKNMTSFLNYVTATQRVLFVWNGSCNNVLV